MRTDEQITIEVSKKMEDLAAMVDDELTKIAGQRMGFYLCVFTYPRASYVSNCKREDVVSELKHLLSLWEQGMPDVKAHKID